MGEIIMRNWDLGESRVQVNLQSLRRQVRLPIRRVITPIRGLLNTIRHVLTLISRVSSYPAHRFHLLPPSLFFPSTTLPSSQEHKVKSYLSITPCHHHELTLSAAYAVCSIHRVQHTPSTAYTQECLLSVHSQDFIRASKVTWRCHIPTVSC